MTIPRCRKATLNLQLMATFASQARHGPAHVGAPQVHSTGDKSKHGGCGYKQISHSKFIWRFQLQWFHLELSMGVLSKFISQVRLKCRTTMTFQDHMQKLPWTKNRSHNDYLWWPCCTSNRLPCAKLHPKLGRHLFFPWVSRTSFSSQMALMRSKASLLLTKKSTNQTWELHCACPIHPKCMVERRHSTDIQIFSAFPSVHTTKRWAFFKTT